MEKNEQIALNLGWLIVWISAGFLVLYNHNTILPFLYVALVAGAAVAQLYLGCTRCFYFGKKCYILGGLLSAALFKPKKQGPVDPDDALLAGLWIIVALFPVPFLIYYQSWILLAIFAALSSGWFIYRKKMVCSICNNEWCPSKPK